MISIDIPGNGRVDIGHVLLDFNGTIAVDGQLAGGVADRIARIAAHAHGVVLTADTYGKVREACEPLGVEVQAFPRAGAAAFKEDFARSLGAGVACLGNGRNDMGMFDQAALSIAVVDAEGACASLLAHADVVARSAAEGLDLLLHPDRLRATLRT